MNDKSPDSKEVTTIEAAKLPATATDTATNFLQMIERVATNPTVNVEAMKAILDMQRTLTRDEAERAFNRELAALAGELPRIVKKGKVEYLVDPKGPKDGPKQEAFKFSKYEDIDKAIRPLLIKHGFSLSFTTEPRVGDGGGLVMVGRLSHVQGHFQESRLAVALDNSGGKNNIQGMGSSSSYGKRYVTCMMLNIITEGEDDDANSAEPISIEQAADFDLRLRAISEKALPNFLKWAKVAELSKIQQRDFKKCQVALADMEEKAKKAGAKQ